MSTLRVVLYAEGAGETGRSSSIKPGAALPDAVLGAGHVVVRRAIDHVRGHDVQFEAPLRSGARVATGSLLHHPKTLRRLLTWAVGTMRPDLAVVLIDADAERARRQRLTEDLADVPTPHVLAVAVQEFEAWLVADESAVDSRPSRCKHPERMKPREAKALLAQWLSGHDDEVLARRRVAERCDLEIVAKRCRSFQRFLDDLRQLDAG